MTGKWTLITPQISHRRPASHKELTPKARTFPGKQAQKQEIDSKYENEAKALLAMMCSKSTDTNWKDATDSYVEDRDA